MTLTIILNTPHTNHIVCIILYHVQGWSTKIFNETGVTCSNDQIHSHSALDLDSCKELAAKSGFRFIFFLTVSDRPEGEYCQIYRSCDETRVPTYKGTTYEFLLHPGKFRILD